MEKLLSMLLAFTIASTSFTGVSLTSVSANDDNQTNQTTDTTYADFRAEALKNAKNVAYNIGDGEYEEGDSVIFEYDDSIIHKSQNDFSPPEPIPYDEFDEEPELKPTAYTTINFPTYGLDTSNGEVDQREFYVSTSQSTSSNPDILATGDLIGQNESINLWYIDTGDTNVLSKTDVVAMKDDILDTSKSIYDNMTADIAKHERVEGVFSNYPYVGDVDFDGRINVLLYDIYGDGTAGSYVAGFFYAGDQAYSSTSSLLPIDALHMDIGSSQGGANLQATDKSGFYGTFAHEFQHLLFHNHIGWKLLPNKTTWINESLSGVADLYYATGEYSSTQTPDVGKFISAIPNTYTYDFFNFNGMKSYGMGYYLSSFMHSLYGKDYIRKLYDYFQGVSYTSSSAGFSLKDDKNNVFYDGKTLSETYAYDKVINSELFGAGFRNVMGVNSSNETSFEYVYRLFMEAYVSDGGSATFTSSSGTTTVNYPKLWYGENLWNFRNNYYYQVSGIDMTYPNIANGGSISLNGYGMSFADGPTHEMMYKITPGNSGDNYLSIQVGNGSTSDALYTYVVLYDSVNKFGDVYPLNLNSNNVIDTNGQDAYLFATTYYQSVTAPVSISWANSGTVTTPGTNIELETKDYFPTPEISYVNGVALDNYLIETDVLEVVDIYDNNNNLLTLGTDYSIEWYRAKKKDSVNAMSVTTHNYEKITNATGQTYTLTNDDVGYQIAVIATPLSPILGTYNTDPIYSILTATVGDLNSLKPIDNIYINYDGTDTLTAMHNSVDFSQASPTDYTYQWFKGAASSGNEISGATGYQYTLQNNETGTFFVQVTPDGNGSYTNDAVFSSKYEVLSLTQLDKPVVYMLDTSNNEITAVTAEVGDILYVKDSDFPTSTFENIIFEWYASSDTTNTIQTSKPTTGSTKLEYTISAGDIDLQNGDDIYVIAKPDTTLTTYSDSVQSDNVNIVAVPYIVSFTNSNGYSVSLGSATQDGANVTDNGTYDFTIVADANYTLPAVITVTNGTVSNYVVDNTTTPQTATFTVTADSTLTGDITIDVTAVANSYVLTFSGSTGYTVSSTSATANNTIATAGQAYSFTIEADANYTLPTDANGITVTNGAVSNYVVDNTATPPTATFTVTADSTLNGDVTIDVTAVANSYVLTFSGSTGYTLSSTSATANNTIATAGTAYSFTIEADANYTLPTDANGITVTNGVVSNYVVDNTANPPTATFTVTADSTLNGDVTIDVTAVANSYVVSFSGSTGISVSSSSTTQDGADMTAGQTYSFTIEPDTNFTLPADASGITVNNGSIGGYNVSGNTATFTITADSPLNGNVEINITATAAPQYWSVTQSGTGVSYTGDTSILQTETSYDFTVTADTGYTLPMPYNDATLGLNNAIDIDVANSGSLDWGSFTFNNASTMLNTIQLLNSGSPVALTGDISISIDAIPLTTDILGASITKAFDDGTDYIITLSGASSINSANDLIILDNSNNAVNFSYDSSTATLTIAKTAISTNATAIISHNSTTIQYSVDATINDGNITSDVVNGTTVVDENTTNYQITLTPATGYVLPSSITNEIDVVMNSTNLSLGTDFTYNLNGDGTATIEIINAVDGNIVITIATSTATPKSYTVTLSSNSQNVTNTTYPNVNHDTVNYQITVTPVTNATLPTSITVNMDGSDLAIGTYSYSSSTGEIIIPLVTGDIIITVIADLTYYVTATLNDANITTSVATDGSSTAVVGQSYDIIVTPNTGFELPTSITSSDISVTMGTTLTFGTDYSYTLNADGTATITISKLVDDSISLTIETIATISTFDVQFTNFDNISYDTTKVGTGIVDYNNTFVIDITADNGYSLPTDIEVKMDGVVLDINNNEYSYVIDTNASPQTAIITIPNVTGDITISGTASLEFDVDLTLVDANGTTVGLGATLDSTINVATDGTYTINLIADSGYILPSTIVIEVGGVATTNFTYTVDTTVDPQTAIIELIPTGDVNIIAESIIKPLPYYDITYNLTNITVNNAITNAIEQDNFTVTLVADANYYLPNSITVVDGAGNDVVFTYNSATGVIVFDLKQDSVITAIATSTPSIVKHSVTYDLTGLNSTGSNSDVVVDNGSYDFTLSVTDSTNYTLPSTIEVAFVNDDGSTNALVVGNGYTYDATTGEVKVISVTKDLKITATSTAKDFEVTFNLTNTKTSNNIAVDYATYGESYTVTLIANEGYSLPDTIEITPSTEYTYDSSTGVINITQITGEIIISCASIKDDDDDDDDDSTDDDDDSTDDDDDDSTSTNLYSITFVDASGNTVTTLNTSSNATLSYIPSLTTSSDNVVFIGWYYNGVKVTTSTVFSSNATVYAKTSTVSTPSQTGTNTYEINTSSSDVAFYVTQLQGGTITINSTSGYIDNLIVLPTDTTDTSSTTTNVILPDSKGNTVMWTIPAGAQIDDDNYLNLGVIVSDYTINPYEYSYGRSIGYIDFAHAGDLLGNGRSLTLTYQLDQANTADYYRIYKLNDYNNVTSTNIYTYTIGNKFMRAEFTSCSKWEVFASNYSYGGNNGNGSNGDYTVYYNIPTFGYIAEFRNVQLNQVLNLNLINVNGQTIIGWYYDSALTVPVTNTSYVVVTQAIVDGGLYPKYGSNYVTPETGNPYPDSNNNYNPNFSGNPSTMIGKLLQLF